MSAFHDIVSLSRLGTFMMSGLPFIAQIVATCEENHYDLTHFQDALNKFNKDLTKLGIQYDIDTEYRITVFYFDKFVCRVHARDYAPSDTYELPTLDIITHVTQT